MYSPRPNTPARNKPTHMYTHTQASLSFPPGNESYSALYYVPFLVFRSLPPSFSLSFHVYGSTAAHGEYIHIYVGECVYISAARRVSTLYICTYVRIYVYIHRNACTRGCAEERESVHVYLYTTCVYIHRRALFEIPFAVRRRRRRRRGSTRLVLYTTDYYCLTSGRDAMRRCHALS